MNWVFKWKHKDGVVQRLLCSLSMVSALITVINLKLSASLTAPQSFDPAAFTPTP